MDDYVMLKIKDVIKICAISKAQIYRKIKTGDFPKPYNQGTRSVAWRSSEVYNHLNNLSN